MPWGATYRGPKSLTAPVRRIDCFVGPIGIEGNGKYLGEIGPGESIDCEDELVGVRPSKGEGCRFGVVYSTDPADW